MAITKEQFREVIDSVIAGMRDTIKAEVKLHVDSAMHRAYDIMREEIENEITRSIRSRLQIEVTAKVKSA
jgi:hypothetical protein